MHKKKNPIWNRQLNKIKPEKTTNAKMIILTSTQRAQSFLLHVTIITQIDETNIFCGWKATETKTKNEW